MVKTQDAIGYARSLIGTPYGSGAGQLDCINLIKAVIRNCPGGQKNYTVAGTASLWDSYNLLGKCRHITWQREDTAGAKAGMLAFKGKPWGCNGQPHHVGIVTKSGTVIHASSAKGKVVETVLDDSWDLLARHRYIDVDAPAEESAEAPTQDERGEAEMGAPYNAVVHADSGSTVNLRSGPGTAYPWLARVPIGAEVSVVADYGEWAFVKWDDKTGYVMTSFLREAEAPQEEKAVEPEWMEDPYFVSEDGSVIKLCGRWRLSAD